jgi:hypothetical protein
MQEWDITTPLEAALRYASDGFRVCPLISPQYTLFGKKTGKHPFFGYYKRASTDIRIIETWFRRHPHANVGLITGGVPGFFALDVDPANNGFKSLAELPPIPRTRENITPSGGRHFLFKCPCHMRIPTSKELFAPGIDVIGNNLAIVAPPSVSAAGKRYQWLDYETPIAEAPAWLLHLIEASRSSGILSLTQAVRAFRAPRWDPICWGKYVVCSFYREFAARISPGQ